jgi:hypothetical protein
VFTLCLHVEISSSDSCSTGTDFDHVKDFYKPLQVGSFWCTCPYLMLLHEYYLPRFMLSDLWHVQIP